MHLIKKSLLISIIALTVLAIIYLSSSLFEMTISTDTHTVNSLYFIKVSDSLYSYGVNFDSGTANTKRSIFGKEFSEIILTQGYYDIDSLELDIFDDQIIIAGNKHIQLLSEGVTKVVVKENDVAIDTLMIEVNEVENQLILTTKKFNKK